MGRADKYVPMRRIVGFIIRESDEVFYPQLEGTEQVFLVYREAKGAGA